MSTKLHIEFRAAGPGAVPRRMATASPAGMDLERVERVRRAIAEGRYRVDPRRIAAGLTRSERELRA